MTLDQLKTFCAIVEFGSFRNAAKALNRSQPAVTNAIKALEDNIGKKLLTREHYRPSLTKYGEQFIEHAKHIVHQSNELKTITTGWEHDLEPELCISIDAIYPVNLLTPCIKKHYEKYPNVQLKIYSEILGGVLERLINGEVSIALTTQNTLFSSFDSQEIANGEAIPIASPKYLQKNIKYFQDAKSITKLRQIVVMDSSRDTDKLSLGLVNSANKCFVSNLDLKKQMILNGIGWGRLQKHLILDELNTEQLVQIKQKHLKSIKIPIFSVKKSSKKLTAPEKYFWKLITTH